jgi:aspartyl-tRNA(Asn)/glutamyl-tRNA(Gln) amidotransferase subunit C
MKGVTGAAESENSDAGENGETSETSETSENSDAAGISLDEVRHVARLARLALTDDEIVTLQGELSALLDHVDKIRLLDTANVPPTAHPLPLHNVLRADEPRPGLDRDEVLAAAPAVESHLFLVPSILGEAP